MAWNLILRITPEAGTDDVELDRQVYSLCDELLALSIASARPAVDSDLPPGAKSGTVTILGAISITGAVPLTLRAIVELSKAWMERNKARSIKVTRGDTTVDLTAVSTRTEQKVAELLEQLLASGTDADA